MSRLSSTNTNSSKDGPTPAHSDVPSAPADAGEPTVTKTVQTVEVRQSAGQQGEGQGVLKPIDVVHEMAAKEPAKQE